MVAMNIPTPSYSNRATVTHPLHAAPWHLLEQKYFHADNLISQMAKFARLSVVTI